MIICNLTAASKWGFPMSRNISLIAASRVGNVVKGYAMWDQNVFLQSNPILLQYSEVPWQDQYLPLNKLVEHCYHIRSLYGISMTSHLQNSIQNGVQHNQHQVDDAFVLYFLECSKAHQQQLKLWFHPQSQLWCAANMLTLLLVFTLLWADVFVAPIEHLSQIHNSETVLVQSQVLTSSQDLARTRYRQVVSMECRCILRQTIILYWEGQIPCFADEFSQRN